MAVSAAAIAGRYGELGMPIVIMAGRQDQIVDFGRQSQRLAEAVPNATLIACDDVGHMIHHDIPDKLAAAVDLVAAGSRKTEDRSALPDAQAGAASPSAADPARWLSQS
jgi:pimeloyl-ACP methyl ester carboxylesterase